MKKDKKENKTKYLVLLMIAILIIIVIILVSIAINNNMKNQSNSIRYQNQNSHTSGNNGGFVVTDIVKKPIIYIYPIEKMDVEVKLGNPQYLSYTYPKYKNGWSVTADVDGTLVDKNTGKNLYALYWEGKEVPKNINLKEGFCVKGKDTATFLEEKLSLLGLSDKEAEEFIIYWLPKMEENNYNYIRFETKEEQDKSMPLEITPKPDNLIRVMMDWKGLDEKIEVQEQNLETPIREGYTVVEWGGTEIK